MIQLWFVSRALGLVALLLLSAVLALGALHNTTLAQNSGERLPRFVLVALHRNLSLITVVFVVVHVITVLITPYLRLRWFDALVPGTARFNPWPAALGVVALDLLLAIVISSALRQRMSKRVWLAVHWTSYACFPVAVAHAVTNASFRGGTWWTLTVPLLSVVMVIVALIYRRRARRRAPLALKNRGRVRVPDAETSSSPPPSAGPARPAAQPVRIVSVTRRAGALDAPTERLSEVHRDT